VFGSGWDPKGQRWIRPDGWLFNMGQALKGFFNQPTWSPPTMESLAKYIGGAIQIAKPKDKESPFYEISVEHQDPEFALSLLKLAYSEADQLLRDQDRREVTQRRAYLEERLARATLSDMRQVLVAMLGQEERSAMMLESALPYGARIIEPPYVSTEPVVLNPLLEVGIRVVAAIMIATILVFGWTVLRSRR
jgi:hypothetical protein